MLDKANIQLKKTKTKKQSIYYVIDKQHRQNKYFEKHKQCIIARLYQKHKMFANLKLLTRFQIKTKKVKG